MTGYDYTAAGYARRIALCEERLGNTQSAALWRSTAWRLWNGKSSLRVDPDSNAYPYEWYNNPTYDTAIEAHVFTLELQRWAIEIWSRDF